MDPGGFQNFVREKIALVDRGGANAFGPVCDSDMRGTTVGLGKNRHRLYTHFLGRLHNPH